MTTTEYPAFKPTETWYLDEIDPAVDRARQKMNRKNPKLLIRELQDQVHVSENGIRYAVLKGDHPEEYSDTEALVMFNPFANAATPNMLVRTEFIREVARFSDIRDEKGKLKPVVMLASPGIVGSKLKLSVKEKIQIMGGGLGPAAKELLHAISTTEIGSVALLGYSQGADMALAGARSAYSANLDTSAISVGDPVRVEQRQIPRLAYDFFRAPSLTASIEATGLDAQKESVGKGRYEGSRFVGSIISQPINWDLIMGMTANTFERRVQEIINEGRVDRLVVGYGSESRVAKPRVIEPALQRLHDEFDTSGILTSVKIAGGNHTWGDQMTILAKLYMRALA